MGAVHGACRLSGYSFSQMIVFGFEAGMRAAEYARKGKHVTTIDHRLPAQEQELVCSFMEKKKDPISVNALKRKLQQVMERDLFIVRNKAGMERALREIETIESDIARIQVPTFRRHNLEWMRAIEVTYLVEAARVIARSALAREESRGFHYRSDFAKEDNATWLRHTRVKCKEGKLVLDTFPVELDYLRPEP